MKPLYELIEEQKELYELLSDAEYMDEDGVVNPLLAELLKDGSKKIEEKAVRTGVVLKQLKADAELIKNEKLALEKRQRTVTRNAEYLLEHLQNNLISAGIKRIEDARVSLSFRKSERIEVKDEKVIPDEFMKIRKEPDKTLIKQAIKNGEKIAGTELIECQNLQIK